VGTPADQLKAGTTAKPAIDPADQRYARRVAFVRENLALKLDEQGNPIPLGIDSDGKVNQFSYKNPKIPKLANNALWFTTTTNTSGKPFCKGNNDPADSGCTSDDRSYASDKLLYYDSKSRLFSPSTPDIPGVPSLNLPVENPASSYTICTEQSSSKQYSITNKPELGQCSTQTGNPMAQIQAALQGFLNLQPADDPDTKNIIRRPQPAGIAQAFNPNPDQELIFASNPPTPSQPVVNVIDIVGDFNSATCKKQIKITLYGNENTIFVLRKDGDINFGNTAGGCSVSLNPAGVDPNNIFWAINGNVQWSSNTPSQMAGTFITKSTVTPNLQKVNSQDYGVRLLGFNTLPSQFNVTAIKSKEEPYLVPVLQIHSPEGSPSSAGNLAQGSEQIQNQWIQQAKTNTTFNAAFVSSNSPSRQVEEPAGLDDFVRFLENWQRITTNIKGEFIQFKRSAYATGPFAPIRTDKITKNEDNLSMFGYNLTKYPTGDTPTDTLPYYIAPTRQWRFDVGLLSKSPDLFAQKFTQQPVQPPSEFFREVGRNDTWVQTLLCAADASDRVGGKGAAYTQYAVPDKNQRPSACQGDNPNYPPNLSE
jgi:hypothetical protein